MRVLVITPPEPVVSLEEAKAHLKVRHDDEDALIEAFVAAATGHIDGPNGWLGRAIGEQDLELRLNTFACTEIMLPFPEIIAVDAIKYFDEQAVEQTLDPSEYELAGRIVAPAWGKRWPSTILGRERVRISYGAGYTKLPDAIRAAIMLMTGDLYKNRETVVTGTISSAVQMSTTVQNLLSPFRIFA